MATSPFKFLDAYRKEDISIFFGRDKEIMNLYDALSGVKHLLVYGPAGSGKSSLIECGLRNQFSDADWFAVTIRRGFNINASVFAYINENLSNKIEINTETHFPTDKNFSFFNIVEKLYDEQYQSIYLIFDQFEELFISGSQEEQIYFFTQLNKLIHYKIPCRVLLIMREEFIGHIADFESLCPTIFQHRFRLEKIGKMHLDEIISNILETPHFRSNFEVESAKDLKEKIVNKLPDNRKEIELTHVQVFLDELWQRAVKKENEKVILHPNLVYKGDTLEGVLDSFLKQQIRELGKKYNENAPIEVLGAMVSEKSTKLQISRECIVQDLTGKNIFIDNLDGLLKELESRRIIRTLKIHEETQYEITHDMLALVIGRNFTDDMKQREKAEDIYNVFIDKKGLFTEIDLDHLRRYEVYLPFPEKLQRKITKSKKKIHENNEDRIRKEQKNTLKEKLLKEEAIESREKAIKSEKEAIESREKAIKSEKEAIESREKAIKSEKEAIESREKAIESRKKAIESQRKAKKMVKVLTLTLIFTGIIACITSILAIELRYNKSLLEEQNKQLTDMYKKIINKHTDEVKKTIDSVEIYNNRLKNKIDEPVTRNIIIKRQYMLFKKVKDKLDSLSSFIDIMKPERNISVSSKAINTDSLHLEVKKLVKRTESLKTNHDSLVKVKQ